MLNIIIINNNLKLLLIILIILIILIMDLENNIKQWVSLDNQQKKMNEQIKIIRDKKNSITNDIITTFQERNINSPVINISDGKLSLVESQQVNALSLKFLLECFNEYFNNEQESIQLIEFIKNKRTYTTVNNIKRMYNKD